MEESAVTGLRDSGGRSGPDSVTHARPPRAGAAPVHGGTTSCDPPRQVQLSLPGRQFPPAAPPVSPSAEDRARGREPAAHNTWSLRKGSEKSCSRDACWADSANAQARLRSEGKPVSRPESLSRATMSRTDCYQSLATGAPFLSTRKAVRSARRSSALRVAAPARASPDHGCPRFRGPPSSPPARSWRLHRRPTYG